MIVQEIITIDGNQYKRTSSDLGYMLERDGVLYEEAVDPIASNREYTETEIPCSEDGDTENVAPAGHISDSEALRIILGGANNDEG